MLACAREIRTVVRQPPPVYLFSQTGESIGDRFANGIFDFIFGRAAAQSNPTTLTPAQIAAIVFNESVSLSGNGIDEARRSIAHIILNRSAAGLQIGPPGTAIDTISRQISPGEQKVLGSINQIVGQVIAERAQGVDPTNGGEFFGFRDLNNFNVTGLQGLSTKPRGGQSPITSGVLGPFNNSNPSTTPPPGLGATDIYFVPFR